MEKVLFSKSDGWGRSALFLLLTVLFPAGASAQAPLAVNAQTLTSHRVKTVPLSYPSIAKEAHVSGTVVVRIVVSPEGDVTNVEPVSGPALLRGEAESCVMQWKFRPFKQNGKSIAVTGEVNLMFTLGDTSPPSPLEKFLGQALPKYVREPELVDRGFSCEIHPEWGEFPAVQSLPSDSAVRAWLEGTELETVEKAGTMPGITAKTPATPALSAAEMASAVQIVDAARQLQKAFFMSWLSLGIYTLPKIPGAQVKESGGETDVEFTVQGVMNRAIFDKDLLLVHFVQQYPNGETVDQVPQFEKTPEGLLYTGTEAAVGQPGQHLTYTVEYQQVEQFRLPKTVAAMGTIAVHFRFQNCKVNPPAPPTHLRVVHVRPQ